VTGRLLSGGVDADAQQDLLAVLAPVLSHIVEFRLLDASGMERLRLTRAAGGGLRFVGSEVLVSRASSACFLSALGISPGYIFLAPLSAGVQLQAGETMQLPVLRIAMPVEAAVEGQPAGLMVFFLGGMDLYWLHVESPLPPHDSLRRIDDGYVYNKRADGVDVLPVLEWPKPAPGLNHQREFRPAAWLPLGEGQQQLVWHFGVNLPDSVVDVRLQGWELETWAVWAVGVVWIGLLLAGMAISRRSALLADADRQRLLIEVKGLSQRLMTAHEDERRALARVLHDEVGQALAAVQMRLGGLAQDCEGDDCDAAERVRGEELYIRQVIDALRGQLTLLRPPQIEAIGLRGALLALLEGMQQQDGLEIDTEIDPAVDKLDSEQAMLVYRLVKEALINIQRHAAASRAVLHLKMQSGHLDMCIEDDGCGFDMQQKASGFGLIGMREQAELLGGELHVDSSPGGGTRLRITTPAGPGVAHRWGKS
ncbi:MAG: sensor histidine kinase, partial [Mariprofundaceae bacterium]|nr:sensor histidine kinase [Mariprofundaceae bacterium]